MTTQEQLDEWREDADRLAARAPTVPFFELMTDCSAAIVSLIAEVERLQNAIRNAETLSELTHLVGPTDAENDAAAKRIQQIDAMYARYGNNPDKWPDSAYAQLKRLNTTQGTFERRYA